MLTFFLRRRQIWSLQFLVAHSLLKYCFFFDMFSSFLRSFSIVSSFFSTFWLFLSIWTQKRRRLYAWRATSWSIDRERSSSLLLQTHRVLLLIWFSHVNLSLFYRCRCAFLHLNYIDIARRLRVDLVALSQRRRWHDVSESFFVSFSYPFLNLIGLYMCDSFRKNSILISFYYYWF